MKNKSQRISISVSTALLFFLSVTLIIAAPLAKAESVISNSINITSNGTNHSSVTTIIDGEVVEDWSETSDGPIEYTSTHYSTSSTVTTNVSIDQGKDLDRERMLETIAHLQALILLYVSLLNY